LLRQAEVGLAKGKRVGESCYRWRSEFGMKLEQARRMKDLQKENDRLKMAVVESTQTMKEALEGNF
jgi:putative transposase